MIIFAVCLLAASWVVAQDFAAQTLTGGCIVLTISGQISLPKITWGCA